MMMMMVMISYAAGNLNFPEGVTPKGLIKLSLSLSLILMMTNNANQDLYR